MCISNNFVTGVAIAVWTVVQTSFHIVWAVCGYYFYICRIKPSHYGLVILYLTYFYKDECGDIDLDSDDIITWPKRNTNIITLNTSDTDDEAIHDIVQTILDKAILPKESSAAFRTNLYFYAFIVSDAVWIITAFLLFAGTCFHIKKCLSLLFYCPWLIVTGFIILLDVVAAVHFGLDIYHIHNFTTWLNFIGVENYKDFSTYNDHELSHIIPVVPAISLCMLFSRFLIIWILNIVNFFQILNVTVLAFQDNLDGKNCNQQGKTGDSGRNQSRRQDQYIDNSASRIRSWQLFYGAIETTSTTSRSSSKSSDKDSNSNDSNRRPSKCSFTDQIADVSTPTTPPQNQANIDAYGRYISTITITPNVSVVSSYYRRYSDVAEDIDTTQSKIVNVVEPLRRELPWSYIQVPEKKYARKHQLSNIPVEEYNRIEKPHEFYKNAKVNNTEL